MVFSDILAKYSQVITVNENQRDLQSFVTECVAFFSCKVAQNDVLSADDRMAFLKLFGIPDNYDVFVSMTSQINLPLLGFSEEEVDEIALRIIEKELELKVSVSHEPVEIINIHLVDQYRNKYSTLLSAFFKKIKHQDNYRTYAKLCKLRNRSSLNERMDHSLVG